MIKWFKDNFSFSMQEQRGIWFLCILLLILLVGRQLLYYSSLSYWKMSPEEELKIHNFQAYIDEAKQRDTVLMNEKQGFKSQKFKPKDLFVFDPNTATTEEFLTLGLSEYQVKVIQNFRTKGGVFYAPESFKKIYTITEEQYLSLAPYIQIKKTHPDFKSYNDGVYNSKQYPQSVYKSEFKKQYPIIDLNGADTSQLNQLRGIGPVLAQRIVDYRTQLQCFVDVNQLKEVYGISEATFLALKDQISIKPCTINKINLKTADYFRLKRHPYMKGIAQKVVYLRSNQLLNSFDDLVSNGLIDASKLPYFKLYFSLD